MRAFDFAPLLRSSVGFENLNRLVDFATRGEGDAYPPYNIEKLGEGTYRISMAVAGFGQDELDLTVQENVLIVTGRSEEHTSELQSLMRISYAVFCLKKNKQNNKHTKKHLTESKEQTN